MSGPERSSVPPAADAWERAVADLIADPDRAGLARDCYFDGTPVEAAARYWSSEEWLAVRALLPAPPGRALDVGAGRGIASYALARDGWRVSALEPDGSALVGAGAIRSLAAASGYDIAVCQTYGEDLPFGDREFDLVLARQALHHARDLRALLRELHRVLRPGGTLIALRDHVISRREDLQAFRSIHPLHRFYGGENAYLLDEYTGAIRGAGLRIERLIAPLESAINFAPLRRGELLDAIAARLPALPGVRSGARRLLGSPALGGGLLRLIGRVDRRPGRLYSFVARRPEH